MSGGSSAPSGKTYRLEVTEPAEAEMDAIYLWMQSRSMERAHQWYTGLLDACRRFLPFPYQYPAVPEYGQGIRRMVYGTGANRYLILYLVVEPDIAAGETEGIVRIAHVYHASRRGPVDPVDTE